MVILDAKQTGILAGYLRPSTRLVGLLVNEFTLDLMAGQPENIDRDPWERADGSSYL